MMRLCLALCLAAPSAAFVSPAPRAVLAPRCTSVSRAARLTMAAAGKDPVTGLSDNLMAANMIRFCGAPAGPKNIGAQMAPPTSSKLLGEGKRMKAFLYFSKTLTNLFPIWTVLVSLIALRRPETFLWLTTEYFTAGLATLMLSMGITLAPSDFVRVATRPNAVLLNFVMCYAIMPALGLGLGKAFGLDAGLVAGLVLVGSINGGQASNLCTYIAKGNVAQSVLMTTATTIGCIFMTPLLCQLILGTVVPIDAVGIVKSTLQVVLAPIILGMGLNKYFNKQVKAVLPLTPVIGVLSTCMLVGAAVAQVAGPILNAGLALQIPVMLLHMIGGLVGYGAARALGFCEVGGIERRRAARRSAGSSDDAPPASMICHRTVLHHRESPPLSRARWRAWPLAARRPRVRWRSRRR